MNSWLTDLLGFLHAEFAYVTLGWTRFKGNELYIDCDSQKCVRKIAASYKTEMFTTQNCV